MSIEVKTNVIKRSGEEVSFDLEKIINAIRKANKEVDRLHQMNEYQINAIADNIAHRVEEIPHAVNVEDIQDMVETGIMEMRGYEVAQKYVCLLYTSRRFWHISGEKKESTYGRDKNLKEKKRKWKKEKTKK